VHCHAAALRLAVRAKGVARIALTTDAMAAAGMPAGAHELAGRRVVSDGVAATLPDGTLAGSLLTMDRAVRNMVALARVPPAAALRMAAEVPARILGRPAHLAAGELADVVLLDDELRVRATLVGGEVVFEE
jgi:N-acetylglucosamine-6-phosphate deacetylase